MTSVGKVGGYPLNIALLLLSQKSHLDLDVPGVVDVLLNQEPIVSEAGRGFLRGKSKPFPEHTKHTSKILHSTRATQ